MYGYEGYSLMYSQYRYLEVYTVYEFYVPCENFP